MIQFSESKRTNDIIFAALFYIVVTSVFIFYKSLSDVNFLDSPRQVWAFAFTFFPFSMAVVMFKGVNARMILGIMTVSLAYEYMAYGMVIEHAISGDASDMFRLHGPLISFAPAALLVAFRVQLTMKLAVFLYRFEATRKTSIYLLQNVKVTRLDIYMVITNLAYALITFAYFIYLYLFYAGLGGEWSTYDEYIAIMVNNGGQAVHEWRYILYDIVANIEVLFIVMTCIREYKNPDALSLKH